MQINIQRLLGPLRDRLIDGDGRKLDLAVWNCPRKVDSESILTGR